MRLKKYWQILVSKASSHSTELIGSILFGLALLVAASWQFSFISLLLFLVVSFFVYLKPAVNPSATLASFLLLLFTAPLITNQFLSNQIGNLTGYISFSSFLSILLFSIIFYLIIGIKNVSVIDRRKWYFVVHLALLYVTLILFFGGSRNYLVINAFLVLVIAIFLLREFFYFNDQKKSLILKIIVLVLAFVFTQLILILSILPIGVASATSIALIFLFTMTEFTNRYLHNAVTAKFIRLHLATFVVLTTLVLASANWLI